MNLIGEHTDYNDGLAMPFAIERGVTVTAEPSRRFVVDALDLDERDEFDGEPEPAEGWRAFPRGMVAELRAAGFDAAPAHVTITGDVPQGSGLSSSAALETALALALLGRAPDDLVALAQLCSRVENEWVGAETGLLDQLAALCSREAHVLRIDFRSLEVKAHPLDLGDWQLVTVDSGATHSIAASGYNQRRAECRAACEALGITSLRDATLDGLDGVPLKRTRHVLTENARVEATAAALDAGDLEAVGAPARRVPRLAARRLRGERPRGRGDGGPTEGRRSRRRPDGRRRLRRFGAGAARSRSPPAGGCPRRRSPRCCSPALTRAAPARAGG